MDRQLPLAVEAGEAEVLQRLQEVAAAVMAVQLARLELQRSTALVLLPSAVSECNRDNRHTTGELLFRTSGRSK